MDGYAELKMTMRRRRMMMEETRKEVNNDAWNKLNSLAMN